MPPSKPKSKSSSEEIIVRPPVHAKPSIDVELQIVVDQIGEATVSIMGSTASAISIESEVFNETPKPVVDRQ
jgi:hypothetical protein